jgi:hypothetical protein
VGSESLTGTDGAEVTGQQLQPPDAHEEEHRHAAESASAGHFGLPGRRAMTWWFGAFTVYAGVTILTGHADGTWAAWACGGYAVTTILLLVTRNWVIPLAAAAGGALIAPLFWLITKAAPTGEVVVISQSASYLLKHGTPYLPQNLLVGWESYNPYLPFMEIFGLPRSAGLGSVIGDPRIWTTLVTIAALAAAFAVVSPHRIRDCRQCRNRLAWLTTVAVVSPVIAFPLSVGVTDPPVIALTCLTLALAYRQRLVWAGLVLALACAMKTTAWAVIPVLGVMAWVRYSPRAAARFAAAAIGLTVVLAAVGAPMALAARRAHNAVQHKLFGGGGVDGYRGAGVRGVAADPSAAGRPRRGVPPRGRLRGAVHPRPVDQVRLLRLPAGAARLAGADTVRRRPPGVVLARPRAPAAAAPGRVTATGR